MEIEKESLDETPRKNPWYSDMKIRIGILIIIIMIILAGFGFSSVLYEDAQTSVPLYPFNVTFKPLTANMFLEQFTLDEGETRTFERNEFLDNVTLLYFYLYWQDVQFAFPDEIRFRIIPPNGCNVTFTPSNEIEVFSNGFNTNEAEIRARISEIPKNTTILAPSLQGAVDQANTTFCHNKAEGIWTMEVECLGDGSMNLDTGQLDSYTLIHFVEIFEGNVTEG